MSKNLTLGERIKRYRLINDIRQEDMAEKLGVSRATLINYEKSHTAINIDVIERLNNEYPDFQVEYSEIEKPKIIENNVIDFKVLFDVLHQKRKNIILTTFFYMCIGFFISFLFTKYYSAHISLYPATKDQMQGLDQFRSLAMNFGMNTPNNDQDFNIPDVVKSRLIANKVINKPWITKNGNKMNLIELWNLDEPSWFNVFFVDTIDLPFIKEEAIKKFSKYIDVSEDRLSGLININVTFEDPIVASSIANFIGDEVQNYIQKENSAQSTQKKIFITERLSIVKKELELSEQNLKDFKERNRGYEDSPELFMLFSRFYREVEVKKEIYLTLQQQLELTRIDEVKETPILHILDKAVPPQRKSSPNRLLFLFATGFIGLIYSSTVTIFKY